MWCKNVPHDLWFFIRISLEFFSLFPPLPWRVTEFNIKVICHLNVVAQNCFFRVRPVGFTASVVWAQLDFSHRVNGLVFNGKIWIVFLFWAIIGEVLLLQWVHYLYGTMSANPSPVYLYTVKIDNFRHILMSSLTMRQIFVRHGSSRLSFYSRWEVWGD